jgi:hypothetical protein
MQVHRLWRIGVGYGYALGWVAKPCLRSIASRWTDKEPKHPAQAIWSAGVLTGKERGR